MATKADLRSRVSQIFAETWKIRDGRVVPDDASVTLGNVGVKIQATVLYADLTDSTTLVDGFEAEFAAEVYKSYLACAATIIKSCGGVVTAYDGDRVMAIFIGDRKNSLATRAALKLNCAVQEIINPAIEAQYGSDFYEVAQVIGIDSSDLVAAKTGIRTANDLVWVGSAANHAAKLCGFKDFPTYITTKVYNRLSDSSKYCDSVDMWQSAGHGIYGSHHSWEL